MNDITRQQNILKEIDRHYKGKSPFVPIFFCYSPDKVILSTHGKTVHIFDRNNFYISFRCFKPSSILNEAMKHSEIAPALHFLRFIRNDEGIELVLMISCDNRPVYLEWNDIKEFGTFDRLRFHGYGWESPVYVYNKKDELLGFIMPYRMEV